MRVLIILVAIALARVPAQAETRCEVSDGAAIITEILADLGGTGNRHIHAKPVGGRIISFEYQTGAVEGVLAVWKEGCLLETVPVPLSEVVKIFGAGVIVGPGGDPA